MFQSAYLVFSIFKCLISGSICLDLCWLLVCYYWFMTGYCHYWTSRTKLCTNLKIAELTQKNWRIWATTKRAPWAQNATKWRIETKTRTNCRSIQKQMQKPKWMVSNTGQYSYSLLSVSKIFEKMLLKIWTKNPI